MDNDRDEPRERCRRGGPPVDCASIAQTAEVAAGSVRIASLASAVLP